jgi:methylmalonyl-CoA/ethylmalonyl-CoA epimerase
MDPGPSSRPPQAADLAATAGRTGIPATGLDHTAICVRDIDGAIALFEVLLGIKVAHREQVVNQRVSAAFFDFPNGASLELVSPEASLGGNPALEKFLEKRGDALHHLALRVRDIDAVLDALAARGVPLIDRVSRPGARGHKVAFLHPKAMGGTLLELVEAHEEPASTATSHDPR